MKGKLGTGNIKIRMFGAHRSIITLVSIARLHCEDSKFFMSIMNELVNNDFEYAVKKFADTFGKTYTLYMDEETFSEDIGDGREVLKMGYDD
jgi:hypothetical protein